MNKLHKLLIVGSVYIAGYDNAEDRIRWIQSYRL
jgi:hypothetical protein